MIKTTAKITLIIFLYYLTYYFYLGLLHPIPALGDSWDYHIPISKSILNGTFLHPTYTPIPQVYYPGSAEAINSLLLLLHIPLTLSNLLAILALFFTCWKLGTTFRLRYYYALLFSFTICTLGAILRWANAVSIDVWVAIFFYLTIILLENPKKTLRYFLLLGTTTGMLIGSKYIGILYLSTLLTFYLTKIKMENIKSKIKIGHWPFSIGHSFAFLLPFSLFGLFWYIRNYILLQNPFYPLCLFHLKCQELFPDKIFQITQKFPLQMLDAIFSEYKLWLLAPLTIILFLLYQLRNTPLSLVIGHWSLAIKKINSSLPPGLLKLTLLGYTNLFLYLLFPTSNQPWIMVSSLRYSYPAAIPLILAIFIIAKHKKKESLLAYFSLANMLPVLTMTYYPKLLLLYLPLSASSFYLLEKFENKRVSKSPLSPHQQSSSIKR